MFFSEAAGRTVSFPVGTMFYDGWVTEFVKTKPPKPEEFDEWVSLGMLPPRNIRPRNLRRRRGVTRVTRMLRVRNRRQHHHKRGGEHVPAHRHSSTRTSRIIPASMWYSRWQW